MIQFTKEAWEHYLYWQNTDKTVIKKINQLRELLQVSLWLTMRLMLELQANKWCENVCLMKSEVE